MKFFTNTRTILRGVKRGEEDLEEGLPLKALTSDGVQPWTSSRKETILLGRGPVYQGSVRTSYASRKSRGGLQSDSVTEESEKGLYWKGRGELLQKFRHRGYLGEKLSGGNPLKPVT